MFDNVKAGQKISDLRKSMNLTQDELASRLNISPQAVSKWENGRAMPELSLLVELAEALGSTIDAIIFPEAACPAAALRPHRGLFRQNMAPEYGLSCCTPGGQAVYGS